MQFLAGTDTLADFANYCIKLLIWQERTNFIPVSFQGKMHRNKKSYVIWTFVVKKKSKPGIFCS